MGLESGTFIDDLVITNPTTDDLRRFGDDHLRLIKTVLKSTFPNANGAINPSVLEFNYLVDVTAGIQAQLDDKLESASLDLTPYGRFDTAQTWEKHQHITPVDHGSQAGTLIIDLETSDAHKVLVDDNLTISFSNAQQGQNLFLWLGQNKPPPAATITLSGFFYFPFGVPPSFTQTEGKSDVVVGKYVNGIWLCGFLPEMAAI